MRVMILYEHCSPHQVTAVEAALRTFREQGHELIPVEFYYGARDYTWTLGDKKRSQAWVCLFPDKKQVNNFTLFTAVKRKIREFKIDVVAINGWYGLFAWWLVFLKRWVGCKVILVSDSVSLDKPRAAWKELPKKWLVRQVDAGFVAGQPQEDYLNTLGMPRERISHGIDVVDNAMYNGIPIRSVPRHRPLVIGTAARLIHEKNLPLALKAFAQVAQKYPPGFLVWHLAGQGPLEAELRNLADELQASVVFRGFVGYDDMPGFYAGLDLYWQPSLSDSWGLVVNEAMASGLPVLVSNRCGCHRDLVQANTGWVHDITLPALVEGLEKALSVQEQWPAFGQAARHLIARWDVHRYAQGLVDACCIALGQRK